jgi:hypothetical protein
MSPVSRRETLTLALGLAGVGMTGACGGGGGGPASRLPRVAATHEPLERKMADRVDADRAKKGLPALSYEPALAEIARFHASDMRTNKFFAHDSPTSGSLDDRLAAASFNAATARENLAEAPDVDQAEDGLLASPGHYANIMADDITHIGVGIVHGGLADPDNLLFVQVFASPLASQSIGEATSDVMRRIADARRLKGLAKLAELGLLVDIARKHVEGLDDAIARNDLGDVAQAAVHDVEAAKNRELSGVTVAGSLLLHTSMYEPPAAALDPGARSVGVAVAEGRDDKGRRALVVLLLVGK